MTRVKQATLVLSAMVVMLVLLGFAVVWLALSNGHLADQAAGLRRQVASLQSARDSSLAELRGQITDLQRQVAALSADNQRLAQLVRDLGGNPEVVVVRPDDQTRPDAAAGSPTARTAPPARPSAAPSPSPSPRRPASSPSPTPSRCLILAICLP